MPNVQGLSISRAELAGNFTGIVTIFSISFLIAKYSIVNLRITLSIYLFIKDFLFAKMSKRRPIEIKTCSAAEHAVNTLLVSQVCPNVYKTNNYTVLDKAFSEAMESVTCNTECSEVALRRGAIRRTGLLYRVNANMTRMSAKIFRTLQTGIRRSNAKM